MGRPALVLPTLGGAQLWADRRWRAGWRVQQHVLTGHHRLLDPADRRHFGGSLDECVGALEAERLAPASPDVIVLLHGLARSRRSLAGMDRALVEAGHTTVRIDYPSTRRRLEAHVAQILELLAHLEGAARVSFVTHSLGGIVVRGALSDPRWPSHLAAHRVVMLAPPNGGAALARILDAHAPALLAALMGPSAREIGSAPSFPAPAVPFCVIAGRARPVLGINPIIEGEDDGIVAVAETRLEGMSEHLVVDAIHTVIMDHPEARAATLAFLAPPEELAGATTGAARR